MARTPSVAAVLSAAVLVMLLGLGTACSGDDSDEGNASTSTSTPNLAEPEIPDELNPDADPDQIQISQEISIEESVVVPARLIAIVGNEVTFTNNTGADAEVTFRNGPIDESGNRSSGPIPPGGTFAFTPETVRSITYEVNGNPDWRGSIQVDPGDSDF